MSLESIMLIFLSGVIVLLLLVINLMQRRITQLIEEMEGISGKININSTEIEELTKNVEEFKKMNF